MSMYYSVSVRLLDTLTFIRACDSTQAGYIAAFQCKPGLKGLGPDP